MIPAAEGAVISSDQWWVYLLGIALTGLAGFLGKAWASRGKPAIDVNEMALNVAKASEERAKSLEERVDRLEGIDTWRVACASIDADHINSLINHIYRQLPPPPPPRPVYPPRPV